MEYIFLIIGILLGCIITSLMFFVKSSTGTLKVDHSDPEKDIYRLEIDDLAELTRSTKIILRVDNNAHISQD